MSAPRLVARDAPFDLIPYNPSISAAWAFVVLFSLGGATHFIMMFPFRAWFFIPLILGCVGEAFGYYGRVQAHDNVRAVGPFLLQLMLILASAPFLAATIYMTLGRIIRALDAEQHSMIRTRWLTKIYVLIDVACFVMQLMGSAMQGAGDAESVARGQHIVVGGLAFQLVVFVLFIGMAARFHVLTAREPTRASVRAGVDGVWQRCMVALYAVSGLVLVRNAYRIAEFVDTSQTVAKSEVVMYVFDAFLMFMVVVVLAIVHPGRLIKAVRWFENLPGEDQENDNVPLTDRTKDHGWVQWR